MGERLVHLIDKHTFIIAYEHPDQEPGNKVDLFPKLKLSLNTALARRGYSVRVSKWSELRNAPEDLVLAAARRLLVGLDDNIMARAPRIWFVGTPSHPLKARSK